jgi:hypothetical protein
VAWSPTWTGGQGRRTAVPAQVHGQLAEAEQVQSGDEREGIEMQGGAMLVLQPVICWRRDRDHAGTSGRNHGLISFVQGRAAPGDQPTPFRQLCNALVW